MSRFGSPREEVPMPKGGWSVLWSDKFKQAYKANYSTSASGRDRSRGQPVLASTRTDGSAKAQAITYLDGVSHDPRALIFAGATRNQELMSVVKQNQAHELLWQMPKTGEMFLLTGKMFIVCSSSLSGRFGSGPKNINLPDPLPVFPPGNPFPPTADDYWQSERERLWKELSPAYRASFTWPNPGDSKSDAITQPMEQMKVQDRGSARNSLPAMSFDYKRTKLEIPSATSKADEDTTLVYNMALDNFCLLIFRVLKVEHLSFASNDGVPQRQLYLPTRDGQWSVESLNP
ncbi:hypothetical protein CcCBS67573_g02281 [Chytriomyces confervae]|uniref:Pyridoxamine 5'-phosphate oxidase Alr4036 family FMN-binding domain-containing protein n=1 Tax=Chytriomyces confervae TaxID=246404 RepID=A0A507FJ90_9FUNG|nr:hypothetical protein HDU80_005049 [Chytriomyces hyalinus]TPX76469.1 hypothetical protein CcCBS67573_g02281 [Chytriomyces confervae]